MFKINAHALVEAMRLVSAALEASTSYEELNHAANFSFAMSKHSATTAPAAVVATVAAVMVAEQQTRSQPGTAHRLI